MGIHQGAMKPRTLVYDDHAVLSSAAPLLRGPQAAMGPRYAGRVRAQSELGKGARFILTFPPKTVMKV